MLNPIAASPRTILNGLTLLVAALWMVGFIARLIDPGRVGSPAVDAAMLLVVGFWFTSQATKRVDGGS